MTYDKAVTALQNGELVTRPGWGADKLYLFHVPHGQVHPSLYPAITSTPYTAAKMVDGSIVPWRLSDEDIAATDWTVFVEEPGTP